MPKQIYSAANGHVKVTADLLENGANVNYVNTTNGNTPLILSADKGHVEVTSLLLQKGANVNFANPTDGMTSLHQAAYCGHPEVVKQLLHGGANKDVKDKYGKTALDWARSKNHPAVAALLQ